MKKTKVLNLYAGIGGNRKLWTNCQVTAVEKDPDIAAIYQSFYPDDIVIIGDAHQYLLDHYKEFDFIWSSPCCPTHSDIRRCCVQKGQCAAVYPDMSLYEEIIFLKHFAAAKTMWVVENVKPYYDLLIPGKQIHRHIFWSNFLIRDFKTAGDPKIDRITRNATVYGINIPQGVKVPKKKDSVRNMLRNMVNPELGLHIFNTALNLKPIETEQINLNS